ncbi:hypothetical protein AVEN_56766-1 [Araneus ventricosus]|uniref:Uncharacterized protein n=1 Tax=Araneus ventricosus TaxID=182803 RepID=A0A4Y2EV97_ARAVE|nr:hypothetical protein AVEN_56766-1 [Araneus ventricosus]
MKNVYRRFNLLPEIWKCDVFPSREHSSHEKRVEYLSLQPHTAGQLHLVVIKETFARVIAARGKDHNAHESISVRERIWVGFEEISGVLSCHTCISPVARKLRNHPTVGIDHWEHRSLVVGRP